MNDQVMQIAERIRGLRQMLGYTAEQMALRTDTAAAEYEKLEAGERDFSFTFLYKCARALEVDITELLTGDVPKLSGYSVVRRGEGLPLERRKGFRYSHLASYFKNKSANPFLVVAPPAGDDGEIPLSTHEGEEFDYVLRGTLKFRIDNHTEILHEGDAVYYNSATPHGMTALDGECEFLAMVMDPRGKMLSPQEHAPAPAAMPAPEKAPARKHLYEKFVQPREDAAGRLTDLSFTPPEDFNFAFDVVDTIGTAKPDKTAMVWVSREHEEKTFSFGDMLRASAKAANYFAAKGIKKGDRVMLVLKRHYQFWFAILGLHKIGAVAIPATNLLTQKDFEYRFNAAGVSAIVCTGDGDTAAHADAALPASPTLRLRLMANGTRPGWDDFDAGIEASSEVFPRPVGEAAVHRDDPMLMYFTSGTTGYPKIAVHSFTYPLGHFVTAKYWHNVDPEGMHLTVADTGWGKAVWGKLYGQWLCEAAVFTYDFDRFDAADLLPMFAKHRITTFCAPPTIFRFLIKEDLFKYDLSSLKYATIAGEALNPEVFNQFYAATGLKLMEGFGQTETTLTVANLLGTEPKPGSMGKPNPQYAVDLIAPDGASAKVGEVGEIVLRTDKKCPPGMFTEYYRSPEKTLEAWSDHVYHTGDMAWRDEDGYFWYVGRTDDLIKSSGYRIGPFEIESVLMELPYVLECAVTGVPDEIRGQVVKATIVLVKGKESCDALQKEIQEYVKERTAPYKYPRVIEFVEALPKTISGKIRRVELREK